MICVFDCETIPDVQALQACYGFSGSFVEICELAFEEMQKSTGSAFLPHCFHKVISIAGLIADESGMMVKIGCFEQGKDERSIIASFLSYLHKQPRLVSFNGRGFDIPVLMMRAMRYNLQAAAYFETTNETVRKDKWENYRQRYSERFHLDLFDTMGHFGAANRGLKLHHLAAVCNIPGKFGTSGDCVHVLYDNHEQERIDSYCEADVVNTYWLFLKFELLCGHIDCAHYAACLEELARKIAQKPYADVFSGAIEAELQGEWNAF